MSTKSILKVVVAFGILALLLAFLGVNYVPRIFASSPSEKAVLDFSLQVRPDYVNEQYQRSIVPQLSYAGSDFYQRQALMLAKTRGIAGSDFFQRQASVLIKPSGSSGSDYFERHALELTKIMGTGGSEFLNHHPFAITQSLNSVSSDFLNHHPFAITQSLNSVGSDFLNHHPYDVSWLLKSALSDNREPLTSEYFSDSDYSVPGHKP